MCTPPSSSTPSHLLACIGVFILSWQMLATFVAKRSFRFTIALLLILVELVLWVVLIGVPWNFGMNFGRPICEATKSFWLFDPVWAGPEGGWKADWGPSLLEYVVLICHFFTLVAIPLSMLFKRGGGRTGQREREGAGQLDGWTGVAVKSLRTSYWFTALACGALVIFGGQAVADFRFGIAWAAGVTKNEFNTAAVGTATYDAINALLFLSLTIGFALASIAGRWLLAGLSCTSFVIFLIWCGITLGGFMPLFIVSSWWIFFSIDSDQGSKDCAAIFETTSGGYEFARTACDVRTWSYIGTCQKAHSPVYPLPPALKCTDHAWPCVYSGDHSHPHLDPWPRNPWVDRLHEGPHAPSSPCLGRHVSGLTRTMHGSSEFSHRDY